MGIKVRDVDDLFVGAPFRDEETKLLFAYDYDNNFTIRVAAAAVKPALYKELKRLGVGIFDRIIVTGLLTEGGEPGNRVIGAMGVNMHTGEFHVFKAKATIISTAKPTGLWVFSTELKGMGRCSEPNHTAESFAMMWNAGVEFTMMEASSTNMQTGGFGNLPYSTGNAHNTWFACTLVDAERQGNPLGRQERKASEDRGGALPLRPRTTGLCLRRSALHSGPSRTHSQGRIQAAPLRRSARHARARAQGHMGPHDRQRRQDPGTDLLDLPEAGGSTLTRICSRRRCSPPTSIHWGAWWKGYGPRHWRGLAGGGPVFDWDFRTNLEGSTWQGRRWPAASNHSGSATTGRYAGRKAAEYARRRGSRPSTGSQVDKEKARVYAPVNRREGMGWKELKAGLAKIMQDYCGESKNEEALQMGLSWLESMKESELASAYARNPHELGRTLEALAQATISEAIIQACLRP